ncbi:MAG: hypothetical protein EOO97_00035 [Pedobacter sp.]|nr:MAG: hypothetical protein EOO97_00035 [Pedobacter sp.]
MLTLIQIQQKLVAYFENHAQVNTTTTLDQRELDAQRDILFPAVNLEYQDTAVSANMVNHTFLVTIGDRVAEDRPDLQLSVISDSLLVAEDFLTFLQYTEGWVFNKTTSIQNFKDDGPDRVSGVVFRITLGVVRSQNECATPTKS